MNGKLKYVNGDATDPQKEAPNEIVVIPHCCNNKGAWGAGFVLALSKKWKEPEQMYRAFCKGESPYPKRLPVGHPDHSILGKTCYAKIDDHLCIANMIGQDGTASSDNPKPVKYWALASAMKEVVGYIDMIKKQTSSPVVIHCPKFGGLRAGGNFKIILELIKEIWIEQGIDVVVYNFVPKGHKSKPLYKTEITIWSDEDTSLVSLERLGQEASDGCAYCSKQNCIKVDDIYIDAPNEFNALDGFFFGNEDNFDDF